MRRFYCDHMVINMFKFIYTTRQFNLEKGGKRKHTTGVLEKVRSGAEQSIGETPAISLYLYGF